MRAPFILSFIWCGLSILMGHDPVFMAFTFTAMLSVSAIGYLFGRENPEE